MPATPIAARTQYHPPMKKLFLVAGARPNFMKIAPIVRALARHRDHFHCKIVHTGQHYDREMSDVFS